MLIVIRLCMALSPLGVWIYAFRWKGCFLPSSAPSEPLNLALIELGLGGIDDRLGLDLDQVRPDQPRHLEKRVGRTDIAEIAPVDARDRLPVVGVLEKNPRADK